MALRNEVKKRLDAVTSKEQELFHEKRRTRQLQSDLREAKGDLEREYREKAETLSQDRRNFEKFKEAEEIRVRKRQTKSQAQKIEQLEAEVKRLKALLDQKEATH